MAQYGYFEAKDMIESGEPYSLESVATTWRNFAEALRNAAGHLQGTADTVTAQYGTPYQNFGDRAAPLASWMTSVSTNADTVASGLSDASSTGSSAQITMYQEDYSFSQDVERILGPEDALSVGREAAIQRREAQAASVLNAQIDKWTAAYEAFQPGTIAPAPTRTTSGSAAGGSGGTAGGSSTSSGGSGGGQTGLLIGGGGSAGSGTAQGGEFPNSSVVGPDGGDFAGWVRDPRTGFLINPVTGQEFDPITGRWIDPVTGKPFGDMVQYATRLEGLTGGVNQSSGLLASGVGGSPLLDGGGTGLAGLFGGVLPPSLAAGNPAANQLRQSAADSMAAKAYAAQQLALKEASQGGRPYLPPTQAGAFGGGGSRAANRRRLVTEPEATWTSRGRVPGGKRAYLPPMSGGRAGGQRDGTRKRPGWLVEDDVWSADQAAGPAVLGED